MEAVLPLPAGARAPESEREREREKKRQTRERGNARGREWGRECEREIEVQGDHATGKEGEMARWREALGVHGHVLFSPKSELPFDDRCLISFTLFEFGRLISPN